MKAVTLHREQVYSGNLILVNAQYSLQQNTPPEQIRPLEHPQAYSENKTAPPHAQESFGHTAALPSSCVSLERKTALVLETLFTTIGSGSSLIPVSGFRTRREQEEI